MIITTANCPSCGGPITFKVGSSITVICEFCGSAVARTDRDVRNLGKVADLIDTQSPLRVGLEGRFDGQPFVLTGRVQIAHEAGALVVRGVRPLPFEGARGRLRQLEIPYGAFERRIALPPGTFEVGRPEIAQGCLMLRLRKSPPSGRP